MEERERAFWEQKAKHYDSSIRLLGRPLPRILELTAESVSGADTTLEVAAGTGLVTAAIAPHTRWLVATDYAEAMLNALRERRPSDIQRKRAQPGTELRGCLSFGRHPAKPTAAPLARDTRR
jgi:ubiquinone/menaquinone biosynthesis C-methylase UbiE